MATTRRTAKITKPAKKAEYKGAAVVRVYDKKTGAVLGYVAKPSKPVDAAGRVLPWYQITCDNKGDWHCTCEGNAKWHQQCMHIDAVKEICAIRVAQGRPGCKPPMVAAPVAEETPTVETSVQPEQVKAVEEPYTRVETDEEAKAKRWQSEELATISGRDFAVVLPVTKRVAEAVISSARGQGFHMLR